MIILPHLHNVVGHCVNLLYWSLSSAPKPFVEMSILMRKSEHSDINQIKYVLLTAINLFGSHRCNQI